MTQKTVLYKSVSMRLHIWFCILSLRATYSIFVCHLTWAWTPWRYGYCNRNPKCLRQKNNAVFPQSFCSGGWKVCHQGLQLVTPRHGNTRLAVRLSIMQPCTQFGHNITLLTDMICVSRSCIRDHIVTWYFNTHFYSSFYTSPFHRIDSSSVQDMHMSEFWLKKWYWNRFPPVNQYSTIHTHMLCPEVLACYQNFDPQLRNEVRVSNFIKKANLTLCH
jgi:hypothetical protein